jgi:hypothetical protein
MLSTTKFWPLRAYLKVLLSKIAVADTAANHAEALGIDAINNMIALEDLGEK